MRNRAAEWSHCAYPDCRNDRHDESDAPPLCTNHLIECAYYISKRMGINLIDPNREARNVLADKQWLDEHRESGSVVYYVRLGNHVKIGTTRNLPARLASLYVDHDPELLLAVEPGDAHVETQRHVQFAAERAYRNRELFNPSRRLLAHIEQLAATTTRVEQL